MKRQVRSSRRRSTHLLALSAWRVRLVFWCGAVIVGLVSALFALGAQWAEQLFAQGASRWPWVPLVLTPLGLGLIAWITVRFVPQSKGSGIPQAIAALKAHASDEMRDSVLSLRVAAAKIALTVLGLACGASIGREGPTVHVGAAVMHSLGRFAHFPAHYMERGLIMAGGAAGVAAAFNTPLAGVMFAIEEMGRSYDKRTGSVVLVAVMLAGITAMLIMGNYHYFGSTSARIENVLSIWYVIVTCGVAGGVLGGLFSTVLIQGGRVMAPSYARHPVLIAMACGLVVALIGVFSGSGIYGTGYHEAKAILDGGGGHDLLYPFWKLLAT
ncbi:MAG: chloride channel protein, partial [Gammaproteobacteria bacterium]